MMCVVQFLVALAGNTSARSIPQLIQSSVNLSTAKAAGLNLFDSFRFYERSNSIF